VLTGNMNNRSLSLENNNQYILTLHVQAPYRVRIIKPIWGEYF